MKSLLEELMAYTVWANSQVANTILSLEPELWIIPVKSSFPSLHKTILHMWDADAIWWQRLEKITPLSVPSKYFSGDTTALIAALLDQEKKWLEFVIQTDESAFSGNFSYTNLQGEEFFQPLYQVLLHVGNHSTYHRGQLVTILRVLGVETIPQTDFVHWARKARSK